MSSSSPTTTPAPFPWVPILVMGFAWFLGVATELSPSGLLVDIADDLGASLAATGTLTTFFALGVAILSLPLTAFALRFSRRSTLVVVMGALVVSTVIVALAPNLVVAGAGRFLGGAAYALICTLFPAVVVRLAGPGNAGKALTVVFTATSLGTAFGAPLAALTGDAFGWRIAFLAAAALTLIAGVLLAFVVPAVHERTAETLSLWQAARLPGVLPVAIGWSLVMLAHFTVLTYIDAYLADLGAPGIITSAALMIIGVGSIIGTLLISQVSSRSVSAALIVSPATVALGLIVLIAAGEHLVIALIGIGLWGIGLAASVVVYQQTILLTGARAPESATSIGVVLAQLGFAAGATVGGITLEALGLRAVPIVAVAFVLIAIIIAISLGKIVTRARTLDDSALQTAAVDADADSASPSHEPARAE